MNSENKIYPDDVLGRILERKRYQLRDPGSFMGVIGDARMVSEMVAEKHGPPLPFWICAFTDSRASIMTERELETFIPVVENYIKNQRKAWEYSPEECAVVLKRLKEIVEIKKASVSEAMVPDL